MERDIRYSIATLPAEKLLNYVKKDELVRTLPADVYQAMQKQARDAGHKSASASFMKDALVAQPAFVVQLRQSALGQQAYARYVANYQRMTEPAAKAKRVQVRRAMAGPRRGFIGCVASKLEPSDFKDCAENYDRPEYQSLALVPSAALKQSAFLKSNNPLLAPSKKEAHISYLPKGLRAYIYAHPSEYEDYLDERKAEVEYLKSVRRNAQPRREESLPEASSSLEPVVVKRRRDDNA